MKSFKIWLIFAGLLGLGCPARAQTNSASLALNAAGPAWPTDSTNVRLRASLAAFLRVRNEEAARAPLVWPPAALETSALLDELSDLEQNTSQPANPYQLYLTNAVRLDSANYLLQLAALGVQGQTPQLRASFGLRAKRVNGRFLLYSPLRANTAAWRQRQIGSVRFHYATELPKAAATYAKQAAVFDKKLANSSQLTDYYVCENLPTALQLVGLNGKSDYQGYAHNNLSARAPGQLLVLSGDSGPDQFDPHDLWHRQLRNVLAAKLINKAVDEGCAFSYGGSWGLSWPVILRQFRAYAQARPQEDWLATYPTAASVSTGTQRPLLVRYVLNALIVQQLERTKGFAAVKELLSCGPYEPTSARYFQTLERVAGISPANFNATVQTLLTAAQP